MASKTYDFTLAAGQVQRLDVRGFALKIVSASSNGSILARTDTGEEWELKAGQGFHAMVNSQGLVLPFGAVTLRNPSALVAISGKVFIGDAGFDDSTVTGNVSIIDQGIDKTLAGYQLLQSASQGATSGQGSLIAMRPQGRTVAVRSLCIQSTIAGSIVLGYGTGGGTALGGTWSAVKSKLANGTAPLAQLTTTNLIAGAQPTTGEVTGYVSAASYFVGASVFQRIPFDPPIVLTGSNVLTIVANALNRDIGVVFEGEEAP
jgi:hypothetical protein